MYDEASILPLVNSLSMKLLQIVVVVVVAAAVIV